MAYNEALAGRIRAALGAQPIVEEKKMFRGVTFMVNGKMCISVAQDEIMVRIDPKLHDEVIKKECCRTMIMKGKPYMGYVLVKESALVSSIRTTLLLTSILFFSVMSVPARILPSRLKKMNSSCVLIIQFF